MQQALRPALSIILVVLSVLGLINVYGDNSDVEELARSIACSDCAAPVTQLARTPLSQTFHFQTNMGTVVVECQRAAIFLGSYSCEQE